MSSFSNFQPSSSVPKRSYDVFFSSHIDCFITKSLKSSFRDAEINSFIDDDHEEQIKPALLRAIEESRTSIVVLTKEYGDSIKRLERLEKIMECHRRKGQVVIPIYYDVNLWEVRKQSGRFGEAFEGLVKGMCVNEEKEKRWRREFSQITSLPGWDVSSSSSRNDSKIVSHIVISIERILDNKSLLFISRHPVGIDLRVAEVLQLCRFVEKVRIIGIWGEGGIGKTTIAKAVYSEICNRFEGKSFLTNIKDVWEKEDGVVCLQEQLIFDISETKHKKIHDIKMGIKQIKMILHNKKVLIVLDDVNKIDQIITLLCGSREWLGAGSVVFITTGYKHILDQLKVHDHVKMDSLYKMKKMDKSESVELFSWHAFKHFSPPNEFITLSKKAVSLCGGLPLALEVLGSLLIDKTLLEWKSLFKKLPRLKSNAILEILQLSYGNLENSEKDVFLEIASFYVGKDRQYVTELLNDCGFCAEVDISVLISRGLLNVDKNNKFEMHEYLREMGKGTNPPNKTRRPKYIYDVFLSFRGEDTRKSFVGHLYATLKNAGLEVFMDEILKKGSNISPSLLQAIEGSRISIIVFSINYASSSWCLEELEKIMGCHRNTGQEIMPIFYDVKAFEVRKQVGNFGKAFHELVARTSTRKEKTWRRELTAAANISGWDSYNYRTDAALINLVVESVMMKLDDNTYLFIADHPVGVDSRVQEIAKLLNGKSNEIIMVGIWGMGGIGKTTIAKAIFNELGGNFEGKSFLENIRKLWEQGDGPVNLQEQLVAGISKERIIKLQHKGLGKNVMKERLRHKRALVVLDDVDKMVQISALCGSREWFAPGSRIIITARDKHLLDVLEVDKLYDMKELDDFESLELFSWYAFKQASAVENYVELSRKVIAYSGGLPLALEVLGSYLFDRTISAWESVLEKLQGIPNDHIYEKLKISYDGLSDHMEKDIFLDICCFFIGEDRSYVTQILNGCGLHAEIGITRLVESSLVRVDKNNKLRMHSLLCDMGREIVRETSPYPEERSRLWFYDDVLHVLKNNTGTKAVKGLALNLSRNNTLSFNTKAFKQMKRLRLLQLNHVKLFGNHEYLSKDLRWLRWHGFPLSYMPENFCQENLIAIDFRYSSLIQVWKNNQMLERMKILNLSHSCYLAQTPDFSKLPNLEKLILEDCKSLSVVHSSIGCLEYLILLNLKDCKGLIHLPSSIYNLKKLKTLNIDGCSKIDKLQEDIEKMESLTTLMANQTAITQVPFSLVRSKSIKYVSLCGYEGLSHDVFPPLIWSWMSPKNTPKSLIQTFGSISYLQGLSHGLFAKSSAMLKPRSSKSQVSCKKTPATIDFPEQVLMARTLDNFMSSLTIHLGEFNKDIDELLKSISQD